MSTSRLDCARPGMPGHGINASKPSPMKVETEHEDVAGLFAEIAGIVGENGKRQFRTAYVEIPKKNRTTLMNDNLFFFVSSVRKFHFKNHLNVQLLEVS